MTEIQIPYLPSAQFFKILCRLGVNEPDVIGDSDSDPQIRTIGGTVSISAMVPRFRYTEADGRKRVVYTKTETYNIQTSTGELFDADGNIGVNLLNTNSPQMDPQGWTYKATVRPNGGEPFDVPIPSDGGGEVFDLGDGLVFTPSTGITDLETRVKALEDGGGTGILSDEVEQVTLTGNLAYTLPAGASPNRVHSVVFTQDTTGGRTVTYDGKPVAVDLTAGASTVVELHPVAGGYVVRTVAADITKVRDLARMRADLEMVRRSRFGVIGTGGRIPISFRCDHQIDQFIAEFAPLFKARGLPVSVGLVTRSVGNPSAKYEPTTATWDDVKTKIQDIGGEIWSHSQTHSDPGMNDSTSVWDEIVGSRQDIEAQRIGVMGWQQPGGPATYGPFFTPSDYDSHDGRLIRETYPLYESYLQGSILRTLPAQGCFGDDHVTLDQITVQKAKDWIEYAITARRGLQMMFHPAFIQQTGFMGLAGFTEVLDHVVALRDAGVVEVLSASGLAFADPTTDHRPNALRYGDFEGVTTENRPAMWNLSSSNAWEIRTDGGHTGSNYLHLPVGEWRRALALVYAGQLNMGGAPYEFRAWVRRRDVAASSAEIRLKYWTESNLDVREKIVEFALQTQGEWQLVRFCFVPPLDITSLHVGLRRVSGGAIDFDDLEIVAV